MQSYSVTWEMDVEAKTPQEAARIAWASMRANGSMANVFTVSDDEGNITPVDLEAEKEG